MVRIESARLRLSKERLCVKVNGWVVVVRAQEVGGGRPDARGAGDLCFYTIWQAMEWHQINKPRHPQQRTPNSMRKDQGTF